MILIKNEYLRSFELDFEDLLGKTQLRQIEIIKGDHFTELKPAEYLEQKCKAIAKTFAPTPESVLTQVLTQSEEAGESLESIRQTINELLEELN